MFNLRGKVEKHLAYNESGYVTNCILGALCPVCVAHQLAKELNILPTHKNYFGCTYDPLAEEATMETPAMQLQLKPKKVALAKNKVAPSSKAPSSKESQD